jgi:hypothetical protein
MVRQHCGTANADQLDSYAVSANAAAMQLLAEAGLIKIQSEFLRRLFADVLPAGHELEACIECAKRKDCIRETRHRLGAIPDLTPEQLARLYGITLAELIPEGSRSC